MTGINCHPNMNKPQAMICGVYAITRDEPVTATLLGEVGDALAGGVHIVQYRNKPASKALALEQARALRALTESAGALLIINDDIELALAVAADGVHLGRNDGAATLDLAAIRQRANRRDGQFLIGISCYNDIVRARAAYSAGADYIAFGSFFRSHTKPDAIAADVSLIIVAKRELSLPVVAIGGITFENAPQLIAAGADAIAVISSLFDATNIRSQAHLFSSLFPDHVREQPKTI